MAFYHMQMQQENIDTGQYQVTVSDRLNNRPIENARVRISYTGAPDSTIEEVATDSSGRTPVIELKTPPLEYSMEPVEQQPYSEYTIQIEAEGFEPKEIAGSQVLADTLSRQPTTLNVMESSETFQRIVIPPHTLFYEYPPKIEEAEIKPINENGEIVLSKVVVPEYIVVHDGPVNDSAAGNYYVRYKDYIKNVASSEIYATWPDDTIRANILAIMSFTLNRVYTEWYRNKGYDFTITSSTAYDHKWIYGRNIFASIDRIVDELFENYLSRPNVRQPILTQYCDGKPSSWPGYDLDIGASGNKVRQIQEQLNTIAEAYPAVPVVTADGIYGPETQNSVRIFQSIFGLDQTGIVDYPTWYKIQEIYVAVSRIAELR